MYKIKLQPGDYCRRDMGEDKYREVAQRFFDDGCPEFEEVGLFFNFPFFGWYCGNLVKEGFFHGDKTGFSGRFLDYEQIMEKEPMQDIWKDAPEGATHYHEKEGFFYKRIGGDWLYFSYSRRDWNKSKNSDDFHKNLIPRPAQSWHERGELPPVGENCRYLLPNDQAFQSGVIAAHVCGKTAIIDFGDSWAASEDPKRFFPELSDREKAIEEMVQIMIKGNGSKFGDCAKNLYDAGYRKVE